MYLVEIIVALVVIKVIQHLWKRHKLLQISNQFPGPRPWPFVGNLPHFPHDPKGIESIRYSNQNFEILTSNCRNLQSNCRLS